MIISLLSEDEEDDKKTDISSQLQDILSTELKQMNKNNNNKKNKSANKKRKRVNPSNDNNNSNSIFTPPFSLIIFVGTCRRCEEV